MKKIIKILSKILLIISILIMMIILISNLFIVIKIIFFGMDVGSSDYPDTIWWKRMHLKGIDGIITYYKAWDSLVFSIELPILVICVLYQIIYFKILINHKVKK